MLWLDTTNVSNAEVRQVEFWNSLRESIHEGTFWADRIKQMRDQPIDRLKLAIENLPLPAAFREAAIATRALIRARKKITASFSGELALLYWLAAIESFGVPYSDYLQQPGFNVFQSVPGAVLKSLPFTYDHLGYNQLPLLTKTDTKLLVSLWGEPVTHSTLNKVYRKLWHSYEVVEKQRQLQERINLWSS